MERSTFRSCEDAKGFSGVSVELTIKKSRFIAYVVDIKMLESRLKELRKEHKKACHIAWACRYNEDGVLKEKFSDDGEPSGTAGRPILNVLQKRDIEGVAILVVRYFGGVKLGAGGLIRAYGKAASMALDEVV